MKSARAIIFVLIFCLGFGAIAQQAPMNPQTPARPANDLNTILLQIQQAASSANADIGKLRIEKWKTDSQEKQQMQQVADSLQKNIANAVPGLISDVQTSRGGVLASFKLYHNLNVVYEFLSSMADAAGAFGKKEEYQPLEGRRNRFGYCPAELINLYRASSRKDGRLRIGQQMPMPSRRDRPHFANPTGHQFSQREHWKIAY